MAKPKTLTARYETVDSTDWEMVEVKVQIPKELADAHRLIWPDEPLAESIAQAFSDFAFGAFEGSNGMELLALRFPGLKSWYKDWQEGGKPAGISQVESA